MAKKLQGHIKHYNEVIFSDFLIAYRCGKNFAYESEEKLEIREHISYLWVRFEE